MADSGPSLEGLGEEGFEAQFLDSSEALDSLVDELLAEPVYALDTEFHRERTYFPHLALVQVAWSKGIAIVDPLAVDFARFAPVLKGDGLAVIHAADQDLEVLERACGCVPSELFDTQIAAGFMGFSSPALSSLASRLLGIRLEKGDQLTDWTRRPLTANQARYAACDVAYLLQMYEAIVERLQPNGRLLWAQQECAAMLDRSRAPLVPEHAWWKLRQARQLHGKERGVAQSVAAWRERRAQELDQPARFVLSDLALISIAHRPPATREELEAVRTMDGRHLGGGHAAEILQAVAAGLQLSSSAIASPPGSTGEAVAKPAVALAAAWVGERAHQLEIDPAILATRADLVAFLQDPPEGRLVNSWRWELLGEPISRLVSGAASLAMNGTTILLEERSGSPLHLGP